MKIQSFLPIHYYQTLKYQKSLESTSEHPQQESTHHQAFHQEDPHQHQEDEVSVNQEIESFQSDINRQTAQLQVSVEGLGESLQVVLKDREGNPIRCWSTQEFLHLRRKLASHKKNCGKILDQLL